jgi:PST family polysaccharide transporter
MSQELNSKIKNAAKWSTLTEIMAKLITPISSMVLARLLTPDAFGVVATLTMIISFAEIFTDAGFQKYIIQHEFKDDTDRIESINVAFWSNLVMSLMIWASIAIFSNPLAKLVGNPGLGYAIVIACVSIPLEAFSSIQMALYKRDFDFKTLFKVRIVGILIPIVVTIPLAIYFRDFWAILIGTITRDIVNAVLLTYYSKWKPSLFYSWQKFKEMFSFSVWSMVEQVSIWLTNYLDIFIVGVTLSTYYLGIYRTATTTVGQITGLITAATTPVLFSSLSRLQNNRKEFESMFFKFQKWVGLLILPLGVGIFCYKDLVTSILLGNQWKEASGFVGLWGLTSAITILFSHYCSELYRSLGKPKLSVLAQWLHIIVLLPTVYIAARYGYKTLYIARSLVRLELIAVNLVITYKLIKMSPIKMVINVFPEMLGSCGIIMCYYIFHIFSTSLIVNIISVVVATILYFIIVSLFKTEREIIMSNLKRLKILK